MRETPTFTTRCHNIPCGVVVDTYLVVKPWRGNIMNCPSDWDYYGYTELEYHLVDRKGYPAEWLENILTPLERDQLEDEIHRRAEARIQ